MMKALFRSMVIACLLIVVWMSWVVPIAAQDNNNIFWPTAGWRSSTPEEQGMDSGKLASYWEMLQVGEPDAFGTALIPYVPGTTSFVHTALVIRHGTVVMDASTYPFTNAQPHEVYSATKVITSILVGIAIDQGYIEGPDQSIWDFLPKADTANMDEQKAAITLRHLLTHTSGLNIGIPTATGTWATDGKTYIQYVLDSPMATVPGTAYLYQDGNADLVSAILQQATGMSASDYAKENLFAPLGITDAIWMADPEGVNWGGWKLSINGYDLAKIGYLMLHNGQWDDQQIVSADWVAASIQDQLEPLQPHFWEGYSNYWYDGPIGYWLNEPEGADAPYRGYAAFGWGMQLLVVIPDLDMVVVTLGDLQTDTLFTGLPNYILPAVQAETAIPANPTAYEQLQAVIAATVNPTPVAVSPMPTIAQDVSGKTYILPDNLLGWKSLTLQFGEDEAVLSVAVGDDSIDLPIGLDGVYRISTDTLPSDPLYWWHHDVTVASKGAWQDDRTFMIELWDTMGIQGFIITLQVDTLTLNAIPVLTQGYPVTVQMTPQ